jgi:hypothetical protein
VSSTLVKSEAQLRLLHISSSMQPSKHHEPLSSRRVVMEVVS